MKTELNAYKERLNATRLADKEHQEMMDWYCKKLEILNTGSGTRIEYNNSRSLAFHAVMRAMSKSKIKQLAEEYQLYKSTL